MNIAEVMTTMTGKELFKFQDLIGVGIEDIQNASGAKVMYAVVFIMKQRENKATKWDDVLELTLPEVQEYLGLNDDDDPKEN